MQLEKVRNAFEKKGFGPSTYINAKDYKNLLNSLVVLFFGYLVERGGIP